MSTSRLQNLTDGLFAIVMTLLVFELRIPTAETPFWDALPNLLVDLGTYVISFVVLGAYWVGHHTQFENIVRGTRTLLWLNLLFLLVVTLIPFSASLISTYRGQQMPIMIYGLNLMMVALVHVGIWRYVTYGAQILDRATNPRLIQFGTSYALVQVIVYFAAVVISFVSIPIAVFLYVVVPLPYIFGLVQKRLDA